MKICVTNKLLLIFIFILLLISIIYIYLLINEKNINVQKYLDQIYNNTKKLKKEYSSFINNNYKLIKQDNIIYIENFLNPKLFNHLRNIFNEGKYKTKDVIFRKGSGINFIDLHKNKNYNDLLSLYYSEDLLISINKLLNKYLQRVSLNDNNACSLLIYTNKGDYIDWHYDTSNLYGNRYTILLTLINKNLKTNDLSENEFTYKIDNIEHKIKLKENSLIIFEGNKIEHKSTPINNEEKRILMSMVFCDICQEDSNILLKISEKIKNKILYNAK